MKLHIDRQRQTEKTRLLQWLGLEQPTRRWRLRCIWELTEFERHQLNTQPELGSMVLFAYFQWNIDFSPTVAVFAVPRSLSKARCFLVYDVDQLEYLERQIRSAAAEFKQRLHKMADINEDAAKIEEV